ncbi:hypothetical protein PLEOSDRAFT_1107548 [Pleurotus ostreatus PC15]|uniref:Uncharacterized protein n=1 Tax=Pleurotus ostreatus (strain PC15) TaxID=1137138 RepID=A0A067NKJ7_PLEO1|nr:hypothetical protein PLEOSDRAFT_1107548 [Pleurotus ostreatus PC15]
MIRKFSNPHFLALSEQAVSRLELHESDDNQEQLSADALTNLQETLKRHIEGALDVNPVAHDEGRKRKKRKVAQDFFSDAEHEGERNVVLFRLFSTRAQPELVSLAPLPPPPSIYREPECEDSPEMAKKRALFCGQVAVDAEWVMEQTTVRYLDPLSRGPLERAQRSRTSTTPTQSMLLLERPLSINHNLRSSTRQPVATHASVLDGGSPPLAHVPVLNVTPVPGDAAHSSEIKRKRKRVRAKAEKTERPSPNYWAPDPAWGGKCLGYAFGYPSHLNNAYSYDYDYGLGSGGSAGNSRRVYRDTMRKAVASPMSPWIYLFGVELPSRGHSRPDALDEAL